MEVEEAMKLCMVGTGAGGVELPPPQPERPLRKSRKGKTIKRQSRSRFIRANTVLDGVFNPASSKKLREPGQSPKPEKIPAFRRLG
jgi:hypothetical protein